MEKYADDIYKEASLLAFRWPANSWGEMRHKLQDPNRLFPKIDSVFGIARGRDYFEGVRPKYLIMDFSKDSYVQKMNDYLARVEKSETMEGRYNDMDHIRNFSLHLLSAWNSTTSEGGPSILDRLDEYEEMKEITSFLCGELYRCLSVKDYSPDANTISEKITDLEDICAVLPGNCKTRIRQLDNPAEELIHGHRINISSKEYDTVIGILYGGIELPFVIGHVQEKKPEIAYLKYSGYSDGDHRRPSKINENSSILEVFGLKEKIEGKRILVVDDSLSTGRTVKNVVGFLESRAQENGVDVSTVEYIKPKNGNVRYCNMLDMGRYVDAAIIPPTFVRNVWKSDIIRRLRRFEN